MSHCRILETWVSHIFTFVIKKHGRLTVLGGCSDDDTDDRHQGAGNHKGEGLSVSDVAWALCKSSEVVLVQDAGSDTADDAHHSARHLPSQLGRADSRLCVEDGTVPFAGADSPSEEAEERDADDNRSTVKVRAQLSRPEPDENGAEEVEEHVSHELRRGDTDTLWQGVGDSLIEVQPDRPKANVYHLSSNDGLDTVPSDGRQDTIEDWEICTPHACAFDKESERRFTHRKNQPKKDGGGMYTYPRHSCRRLESRCDSEHRTPS